MVWDCRESWEKLLSSYLVRMALGIQGMDHMSNWFQGLSWFEIENGVVWEKGRGTKLCFFYWENENKSKVMILGVV
jgi:hypothetical protein